MATGRVTLITGSARGLGCALSDALLNKGNKVAMCDLNKERGVKVYNELAEKFGEQNVKFYPCDVTNKQNFEDCFIKTKKDFGCLDILINNAGICDETESGWRNTVAVNVEGAMLGSKLAIKYMNKPSGNKVGLVVNMSSIIGLAPSARPTPVYAATKAAIKLFSSSLGTDLHFKDCGIKFITIAPGLTAETDFINNMLKNCYSKATEVAMEEYFKNFPPQRLDSLVQGVLQVLEDPPNGSSWLIEGNLPPVMI